MDQSIDSDSAASPGIFGLQCQCVTNPARHQTLVFLRGELRCMTSFDRRPVEYKTCTEQVCSQSYASISKRNAESKHLCEAPKCNPYGCKEISCGQDDWVIMQPRLTICNGSGPGAVLKVHCTRHGLELQNQGGPHVIQLQ